MVKYESLLLGGKIKKSKAKTKAESESSSESEEEEMKELKGKGKGKGKGMSYEERCKNLAKARETRMANLKKNLKGAGQYNQDYVDESQVNYLGSPLDMYYMQSPKQTELERQERGELAKGAGAKKTRGMGVMTSEKFEEMGRTGGKIRKGGSQHDSMAFMKNSMHTGMSMPTKEQFIRGGSQEEYGLDIVGAINSLGMLASKFGLKLTK